MTRQFTVLHTVRSLRLDGVSKVVIRSVAHRQSPDFRHHVCAMRDDTALVDECRAAGVEPKFAGYTGPAATGPTILRLARLIRALEVDVVHANRTLDLALAGTAAALCNVPVVSTLHWLGRMSDHPEDRRTPAMFRAAEMMSPVLLNRVLADRVIAVSRAVRDSFATLPGFPTGRMTVVYPGYTVGEAPTADARAAARTALGLGADQPVLLNVGRLQAVKGQRHLVPMMTRVRDAVPNAILLIAGEGELRAPLTQAIADAGLSDAIRLLGARDDVDRLLAAADALVVSSESEAAPLPVFEAMRAARPVIATRVGGIPEIVATGVTGSVVPRGDPLALAAAACEVLASPSRALAMGAAGRRALIERFDVDRSVQAVEEIYRSVIADRPRRGEATVSRRTDTPGVGHRPSS